MLKLASNLYDLPIVSLRTGARIGTAQKPILNPNNLKIEGWYALSIYEKGVKVLPSAEVREITRLGIAVNDHEAITDPSELIRMKNVLDINFELLGKSVVTQSRKHLGKVEDYASDLESFFVHRLYVKPRAISILTKDQLTVDRQQIVEITNKKIVIKDIEATEKVLFTAPLQVPEG
jgi:sporulation protein YlmC with PRC-barrel domain